MRSSVALYRPEETLAVLTAVLLKIPFWRNTTLCGCQRSNAPCYSIFKLIQDVNNLHCHNR